MDKIYKQETTWQNVAVSCCNSQTSAVAPGEVLLKAWGLPRQSRLAKAGSAMLLVLMITSTLLLGTYSLWRASALAWEGALEAERVQKQFYLVQGLAFSGVARVKAKVIDLTLLPDGEVVPIYESNSQKLLMRYASKTQLLRIQGLLYQPTSLKAVATWTLICQVQGEQIIILECGNNLQI